MVAGALPLRRRDVDVATVVCTGGAGGGGGCAGVCATRCRLDRRADVVGSAAASTGLIDGCVLRFLREDGAGVCAASGAATVAAGVEVAEAAWLAA
jgi:hypothetical protein